MLIFPFSPSPLKNRHALSPPIISSKDTTVEIYHLGSSNPVWVVVDLFALTLQPQLETLSISTRKNKLRGRLDLRETHPGPKDPPLFANLHSTHLLLEDDSS